MHVESVFVTLFPRSLMFPLGDSVLFSADKVSCFKNRISKCQKTCRPGNNVRIDQWPYYKHTCHFLIYMQGFTQSSRWSVSEPAGQLLGNLSHLLGEEEFLSLTSQVYQDTFTQVCLTLHWPFASHCSHCVY